MAVGATIAVHLVVGIVLLQHLGRSDGRTVQSPSGRGLSVVSLPDSGTSEVPDPADPPPRRLVTTAPLPRPAPVEPVVPTIDIGLGNASGTARLGSQVLDPFAAAGLTRASIDNGGMIAAMPTVRSSLPDLDLNVLLAALLPFQQSIPDRNGTVILRCLVAADGRVTEAAFLGGSLGEAGGARLAQALVGRPLYAATASTGPRTALLGPFSIPLTAEQAS